MADLNILENIRKAEERLKSPEQMLCKGLNMPFNATVSASRKIMWSSQEDHILNLLKSETPIIGTGSENKFGEYASSFIVAEHNLRIVAKINKFSNALNHHYYLIVQDEVTGTFNVIERIMYNHITESYGYLYNNTHLDALSVGSEIPIGGDVKKSTSYDEYNNRRDGVNLITTYLSNEDTKEDGVKVSVSATHKLAVPFIKKISIVINDNDIPLNIYGDSNVYKIIPDIGEHVKDGIMLVTRREKKEEALFSQSLSRLREIMMSDDKIIVKGQIIDLNIYCNNPEALSSSYYSQQLKYYYDDSIRFRQQFIKEVEKIISAKGVLEYDLQKMYFTLKALEDGKQYKKDKPFSNIILDIVVMEPSPLAIGDKVSNRYGGKGVVSKIVPDEEMPMLDTGERVELEFNSSTCVNRENAAQLFETSATHQSSRLSYYMNNIVDLDAALDIYIRYISILNRREGNYAANYIARLSEEEKRMFFDSIMSDKGIMLRNQPISESIDIDILAKVYEEFPFITQYKVMVPQKDSNGNLRYIQTRRKLTCGRQYIFRLKQYAEEKFSATSLSSTNIRNENSRSSSKKSYKTIFTKTPIMFGGMESEDMFHLGPENVIINLMLYSASPEARRLAEDLLTGDPFNIDIKLTDNAKNRGVEILNAYLLTMGLRIIFTKKARVRKRLMHYDSSRLMNMPRRKTLMSFIDPNDRATELYLGKGIPDPDIDRQRLMLIGKWRNIK